MANITGTSKQQKLTSKEIMTILKKKYDDVIDDGGVYTVRKNGKWGFVSKDGKELIAPIFTALGDEFVGGFIITFNGSKGIGFVSQKGKEIVKPIYDSVENFKGSKAIVTLKGKKIQIGNDGKPLVSASSSLKSATSLTTKKLSPKEVMTTLKKKYDDVIDDGGVYTVRKNGKWGFVSKDGKELIAPTFTALGDEFVGGFIITFNGSKGIGFVSQKGKEIVKSKYSSARDFHNGFAAVCLNGKWGFVDEKGKEIVKPKYDSVENFKGTEAVVTLKGKKLKIGTDGLPR